MKYNIDPEMKPRRLYTKLSKMKKREQLAIVIDGKSLQYILAEDESPEKKNPLANILPSGGNEEIDLKDRLFRIGLIASSVVCCRVSPK